jgi:hypothetical protein
MKLFRNEFEYHIREGKCMVGPGANRNPKRELAMA